jgi:hypothetical protein
MMIMSGHHIRVRHVRWSQTCQNPPNWMEHANNGTPVRIMHYKLNLVAKCSGPRRPENQEQTCQKSPDWDMAIQLHCNMIMAWGYFMDFTCQWIPQIIAITIRIFTDVYRLPSGWLIWNTSLMAKHSSKQTPWPWQTWNSNTGFNS